MRAGRTGRGPPAGGDDVKLARSPSPPHRLLDARNGRRWQCGMRAFFGVFGMRISSQSQPPPSLCRKHRLSCTSNSGEVAKNCVQASGVTVVLMFFSIGLTPLRFSSLAREMPCSSASAGAESNEGKISPFQGIRMQVPQAEKKVGGQRRRASTSMLTRGRGNPPVYLPARPHARSLATPSKSSDLAIRLATVSIPSRLSTFAHPCSSLQLLLIVLLLWQATLYLRSCCSHTALARPRTSSRLSIAWQHHCSSSFSFA